MNLDSWNRLTDAQKAAVEAAAVATEAATIAIGNAAIEGDLKALADAGVQVTTFPPEAYEKVRKAYYDGVWKLAADCCGADLAADLRARAVAAGLTK